MLPIVTTFLHIPFGHKKSAYFQGTTKTAIL